MANFKIQELFNEIPRDSRVNRSININHLFVVVVRVVCIEENCTEEHFKSSRKRSFQLGISFSHLPQLLICIKFSYLHCISIKLNPLLERVIIIRSAALFCLSLQLCCVALPVCGLLADRASRRQRQLRIIHYLRYEYHFLYCGESHLVLLLLGFGKEVE